MTDIFLNEKFLGGIDNHNEFIKKIKKERRKGILSNELNIYYDNVHNEIYLNTSKGRSRRPLIIVENGKSLFTRELLDDLTKRNIKWRDLIKKGIIEYVDAAEEEDCY